MILVCPTWSISYISRPGGRFSTFNRGEFIGSLVDTNPQLVMIARRGNFLYGAVMAGHLSCSEDNSLSVI